MNRSGQKLKSSSPAATISAVVEAARPRHWIKNAFVAAPILFAGRFADPGAWIQGLAAVGSFCLLSSSIYLVNDICDRSADRLHPVKRDRPVASGRLSVAGASLAALLLALAGAGIALAVVVLGRGGAVPILAYPPDQPLGGMGLWVWAGGYVILNLLYSFWLKDRAIVDVLMVAMGFVMRAMAGAAAIAVPISPWLVVCTLTLCLFIAVAKRCGETVEMPSWQANASRKAQRGYEPGVIEHMLSVSAGLAILTYSLYCLAPRTVRTVGSAHMIWTIPLVIYGTFRYYRRCHRPGGADIVNVLLHDRVMWLVLLSYVIIVGLVITYGSNPAIRSILDT